MARSWEPLGPSGSGLGGLLGCLEQWEARKVDHSENIKKTMEIDDFCIMGPLWEASWSAFGPSCWLLGSSGGHLGRLRPIVRRLWALLGRLGGHLGPFRGTLTAKTRLQEPPRWLEYTRDTDRWVEKEALSAAGAPGAAPRARTSKQKNNQQNNQKPAVQALTRPWPNQLGRRIVGSFGTLHT